MRSFLRGRLFVLLLASLLVAAIPPPATAQAIEKRVSIWGAVGLAVTSSGELTTAYVPELKYFAVERGAGGQVVTLDGGGHVVATFGADVFFASHAGFEAWVSHDNLSADATSGAYATSLRYVSRPPPSYDPVVVDYQASEEWGPVTTSIARWTTALNGVVRWGGHAPVGATVSGGLAILHTTGSFEPLGYTMFVLGGHSTLVPNQYLLSTEMVPTTVLRGNVGGSIDVRLGERAALTVGLRQILGPPTESSLRVVAVDRSQAGFEPPSLDDITNQLARSTVSIGTASFKATVGVKVHF